MFYEGAWVMQVSTLVNAGSGPKIIIEVEIGAGDLELKN